MKWQSTFTPDYRGNFSSSQTLTIIGLAGMTSILLMTIPYLSLLNYPLRLLLTMVHELGHGFAALLTGGEFRNFIVRSDGSGLAYTAGGWRSVVIPAGYLGTALFGCVLILLGRNHRSARIAMGVIGAMLLLTVRYAMPSLHTGEIISAFLTIISGIVFGLWFLWVALRASSAAIIFLLHMVAIQAGLTALNDLLVVIGLSTQLHGAPRTDAVSMAELTFVPAIVWAILWAITAFVMIGGAIWITWISPATKTKNPPTTMDWSPRY